MTEHDGRSHRPSSRASAAGRPGWFERLTVRSRVIIAVLLLVTFAVVTSGAVDFALDRARLHERVDASLTRAGAEFETLARVGVDPDTGQPFASADQLVRTALQRTIPEPTQGELGVIDGRVAWTAQSEVPLRLEDDPELTAHVVAAAALATSTRGTITTAVTRYEYLVVPVRSEGGGADAIVFAFDMGAEYGAQGAEYLWRALVAVGALVLAWVLTWLLVGRLLEPIGWVRDTAREISDTDLSRRIPVRGDDDLAELTGTVNDMLDRLESTFASQRELLDDVGHELRTPLTVVRGHLELMDPHDPGDALATRDLALDELDRMNRLVEDLILLAKSDGPDFVVPRSVHVGTLVDEVVEKARPLGDRAWRLESFVDVEAELDAQRITQALLQLAANAVHHTSARTVIAFGVAERGDELVFQVRDEGEGVAPEVRANLFDRFVRGSGESRPTHADGRPGLGLGLAIVRSIAVAHGGHVELDSIVGAGSAFRIVVPRTRAHSPTEPIELPR